MTQHILNTESANGDTVKIQLGWDRPLHGFYMIVLNPETHEIAFDNMFDCDNSHPEELDPFIRWLDEHDIELPEPMLNELTDDRDTNAGNKVVLWDLDGNRVEQGALAI